MNYIIQQLSCWLAAGLLVFSVPPVAAEHSQLNAFPVAKQGMQRFVIVLPHKERDEEQSFKVELLVGEEMETDGVNAIHLGGTIEPRALKGWGYTYYEYKGQFPTISTLMAAPPDTPKVMQFVTASPLTIRYNSRLPVVVYAPQGYQVRYRIWAAPTRYRAAEPG